MKENAKNNEKYLPPLAIKITDSNTHTNGIFLKFFKEYEYGTVRKKKKFSIKDFFSKCDQMQNILGIY